MPENLTAVSIFSGCGGFDWGVQQAGVEVVWANDIYPHAAAAYRTIFPNVEFILDDIQNIAHFPRADILIGCYPCTGFSVGARRRFRLPGAEESRARVLADNATNYLYWQFLRALESIRPRFAFIENVGGMTSAEQGFFLEEQMFHFRRLRYDATIARLRATDFGSAQMRERVFIVLTSYDMRPFRYEFPEPTHGPGRARPARAIQDAIGGMDEWPDGEFCADTFHGHYLTRNRKRGWDQQSYTIVANQDHVTLHPMGEPMRNVGRDVWELQGERNRRLSWVECARLQDLPDNIYPTGNLEHKYRVIGNAVPPVFGRALVAPIVAANPAPNVIRF